MFVGLEHVSRETLHDLEEFQRDLTNWSRKINLIAPATVSDSWNRHIMDSVQLVGLSNDRTGEWCDLGSGGGLPALVVSIISRETQPERRVVMIEADKRKAAFLSLMVKKFQLNAEIVNKRIEAADRQSAQIVSARALTELPKLLAFADMHLADDGVAILPKGRNHVAEIEAAKQKWSFGLELFPSITDAEARILKITKLRPKEQK